jgi:hypothetical protein
MFNTPIFNEVVFASGAGRPAPTALAKARATAPSILASCIITLDVFTYGSATASCFASFGGTSIMDAPIATATALAYEPNLIALSHVIAKALYTDAPQQLNRVYVIGIDDMGNPIYGESKDNTAIALYGERLRVYPEPFASTKATTESVAENILDSMRLLDKRGMILIPPNCGMEVWDVISIDDVHCNQAGTTYRVSGYKLDYEAKTGTYTHQILLTGV